MLVDDPGLVRGLVHGLPHRSSIVEATGSLWRGVVSGGASLHTAAVTASLRLKKLKKLAD